MPIDGERELQEDEGTPPLDAAHEASVEPPRLVLEETVLDRDARGAERAKASPVHLRERVAHRGDDTCDARFADRVDARRGPAVMRAGLEGHDERRAVRSRTGSAERLDLRVSLARRAVPTLTHGDAVAHHDCADEWIRARPPSALRGEAEGSLHVCREIVRHGWRC